VLGKGEVSQPKEVLEKEGFPSLSRFLRRKVFPA
jgi:hypothetical protein